MFRARRRCKILTGVLVEYVEDNFALSTPLWTIAEFCNWLNILSVFESLPAIVSKTTCVPIQLNGSDFCAY